ncbi:unnamed protein product, partial [Rotaria sp. Silwood1]
FERVFRPRQTLVAICIDPITYPPASVFAFKQFPDGRQQLLATGSLLSVNSDDVNWFKPIELHTQDGADEDILKNHLYTWSDEMSIWWNF